MQFHITSGTNLLSELFPAQTGKRTPIGYVHFVLTLQGEAWVEIDGHNLHLQKGSFLFLLPNVQLRRISQTDDFLYDYLFFAFEKQKRGNGLYRQRHSLSKLDS